MSNAASSSPDDAGEVLAYWLGDSRDPDEVKRRGELWFASTRAQDTEIRERFAALHDRAQAGELDDWVGEPRPALALVVILDQFTRNLYRGAAAAFANDARALAISKSCIQQGFDEKLDTVERVFLYMPFQHAEDIDDQRHSILLYQGLMDAAPEALKKFARNTLDFAVLHRDIVERFGRFPHRNKILDRKSTDAERRYLEEGGHTFGQG